MPSSDPTENAAAAATNLRYVELMRDVAPYAATAGMQISMKPHGVCLTSADLIDMHGIPQDQESTCQPGCYV